MFTITVTDCMYGRYYDYGYDYGYGYGYGYGSDHRCGACVSLCDSLFHADVA